MKQTKSSIVELAIEQKVSQIIDKKIEKEVKRQLDIYKGRVASFQRSIIALEKNYDFVSNQKDVLKEFANELNRTLTKGVWHKYTEIKDIEIKLSDIEYRIKRLDQKV